MYSVLYSSQAMRQPHYGESPAIWNQVFRDIQSVVNARSTGVVYSHARDTFNTQVSVRMCLMKLKRFTARYARKSVWICHLHRHYTRLLQMSVSMVVKSWRDVDSALENAFSIQDGSSAFNNSSNTFWSQCWNVVVEENRNKMRYTLLLRAQNIVCDMKA
jgi:hypothetical protein